MTLKRHVGAVPSTAINRVPDATSIAPKDGAPTRYPEPCGMLLQEPAK